MKSHRHAARAPDFLHRVATLLLTLALGLLGSNAADSAATALAAPTTAAPAAAGAPPLSRADAEQLLDTLKDPEKRARFTNTLDAYARSLPLQPPGAAPNAGKGAAPAAGPAAAGPAPVSTLARGLAYLSERVRNAGKSLDVDFRTITDFPALTHWAHAKLEKDSDRVDAAAAAVRGLIALAAMGLGELLLVWLAGRPVFVRVTAPFAGASSHRLWVTIRRRLRAVGILLGAALIGNATAVMLLTEFPVARAITFGLINIYVGVRLVYALLGETPAAPATATATATAITSGPVRPVTKLLVALLIVAIGLEFIGGDVVAELGATDRVHEALQKSVALIIHALLIMLVIATRGSVAGWIRRQAGANRTLRMLGETLAAIWPYVAVTAIASTWLVWAMDIPDAYHQLVRFVLATVVVLIVSRAIGTVLVQALDQRLTTLSTSPRNSLGYRFGAYRRLSRATLRSMILVSTAIALTEAWGLETLSWFGADHAGHRALLLILKLGVLGLVGILAWELADFAFEARVIRLTESASLARATRLRTLQPIIRVALVITLSLLIIVTALNEIGINVGPLLAGAGIFGVALGFGSQKLVQDFITGIFLLVEDAVDVGDAVTVAGLSGTVEHLSIRTIRLRAGDGSVHLIPFSSVTSVTNTNRGLGNASVSINLDIGEDTDRVSEMLKSIVLEMRAEPAFSPLMLGDLDLWGVDKVDGSMTTLAGQIVCTDAGRWAVQREFNRRFKKRFAQEGITLAVPRQDLRIARAATGDAGS